MSTRPEFESRIRRYLDAVEKQIAAKPAAARREVIDGLRDQIAESLHRTGPEPTIEDLERIIGEMDAPECFAEALQDPPPTGAAPAPKRGDLKWFLLAVAFLVVNIYGVIKWASPSAPDPDAVFLADPDATSGTTELVPAESAEPAPLRLIRAEQIDINSARELTLRFTFSSAPDRLLVSRFIKLNDQDGEDIRYTINPLSKSNEVIIRTESVFTPALMCMVDRGLPSISGGAPSEKPFYANVGIEQNLAVRRINASLEAFEDPIITLSFTAQPDMESAARFIHVEPETAFTIAPGSSWNSAELALRGAFKPGTVYTITIAKGLPALNGASTAGQTVRRVQIPNRSPALQVDAPGLYLPPQGSLAIPLSMVNLEEWTVSLSPVFANNLVQLAQRENSWFFSGSERAIDLTGSAWTITNRNTPVFNEIQKQHVRLRDLTTNTLRGAYWLQLSGKKANAQQRLIVITDLGIAARTSADSVLVWVNSLRDATPVEHASITVYARNNQIIARGESDHRGLAKLSLQGTDRPFLIVAESHGDLSYLNVESRFINQGENISGRQFLKTDGLEAAVFTERGVYRPGETVFMQAIVRDRQMNAPAPFPAVFRVRRPDGRIFQDVPVMISDYGSVATNVTLPDYLPTGRYFLELAMPGTLTTIGETSVAFEDFVPPQIRVSLETEPIRFNAGDVVRFGVRSEHLFGRAASGLKANGFISVKAAPFEPEGWSGWTFGDEERTFSTRYNPAGSQTLDEDGHAEFVFETSTAWRPPAALELVTQAAVIEAGGRAVTAYGSITVDPYPFYIGLKKNWEGTLRTGERKTIGIAQLQPDGEILREAKPLVIELSRLTWHSVLRENAQGRYSWESQRSATIIREDTISTDGQAVEWNLSVAEAGDYMVLVRDPGSDTTARTFFSAASPGQEWVEWNREKPGIIELTADRKQYRPGDTARVLVKAPFSGPALLTIETDRVLEERLIILEKNTAELEVPIATDHAPNIYCVLTQIRPARAEAVWRSHRAIGTVALMVEPANRELQVALEAPATTRPREKMTSLIRVTDETGQPVTGEATLMAVDEGICLLTEFQTPDPQKYFLSQRALGQYAHDYYDELMPPVDDAIEGISAAGGDMDSGLRRRLNPIKANRFKPVALWKSNVSLDSNGTAAVELHIPEFSGELRLMAVAHNATQTGSGESRVKVKRDLVVQPSLPRFMAIGDRSEASVNLFNESPSPMTISVNVLCGGPLIAENADQQIELAPGKNSSLSFPLTAGPGAGKALFRMHVTGGTDSFDETIELPVRPAGGARVAASNHTIPAGSAITITPPADWLPATIDASGAASGLPALQYGRALDYVLEYPYGCLEQTASGAFPLLYAEELSAMSQPAATAAGSTSNLIASAIQRVLSMQLYDGSFALWPYSYQFDEAASLYAIHFLIEARMAGFAVPEDNINGSLEWLRARLDKSSITDADSDAWKTDYAARAYACHLLSLARKPDAGWNARLREVASRLSFEAQAHIASALLLGGEPRTAVSLMKSLGLPTERERDMIAVFESPVRDASLLLSAWLDIEPANPAVAELVHFIHTRQHDGHWGTTQDNALALLALGKHARRIPAAEQEFRAAITNPDGSIKSFSNKESAAWKFEPGAAGTLTISNSGPGIVYAWSRQQGVGTKPEQATDNGVSIRREILGLDGEPLPFEKLERGEMVIVRLTVNTMDRFLDHLVIEELLPAGWEIENPNLATSQQFGWVTEQADSARFRDARDDRMLFFTGGFKGERHYHYAARAITPGRYRYPPVTISGMYTPEIRSVHGAADVIVNP